MTEEAKTELSETELDALAWKRLVQELGIRGFMFEERYRLLDFVLTLIIDNDDEWLTNKYKEYVTDAFKAMVAEAVGVSPSMLFGGIPNIGSLQAVSNASVQGSSNMFSSLAGMFGGMGFDMTDQDQEQEQEQEQELVVEPRDNDSSVDESESST